MKERFPHYGWTETRGKVTVARKDYDDRRRRQAEGIEKAKEKGTYRGRPVNEALHQKIRELREKGFSIRKTAELAGCGLSTVQRAGRL